MCLVYPKPTAPPSLFGSFSDRSTAEPSAWEGIPFSQSRDPVVR